MKTTAALLITTIVILVLVVVFTLQNAESINVNFLLWKLESSLALVLFTTFSLGIVVAVLALMPFIMRKKIIKESDLTL